MWRSQPYNPVPHYYKLFFFYDCEDPAIHKREFLAQHLAQVISKI